MAEKRYTGAPFGTQTARFDVTGVHPKTKLPGSFTQIPYDRNSMLDLSQADTKHFVELMDQVSSHMQLKFERQDTCLQNIRESLVSASRYMSDIRHIQQMKKSFGTQEKNQTLQNLHDKIFGGQSGDPRKHMDSDTKVSNDDLMTRNKAFFSGQEHDYLQMNYNLLYQNLSGGSSIYAYEDEPGQTPQDDKPTEQTINESMQEGADDDFAKSLEFEAKTSSKGISSQKRSRSSIDEDDKDRVKKVSFEDADHLEVIKPTDPGQKFGNESLANQGSHISHGSTRTSQDENMLEETKIKKLKEKPDEEKHARSGTAIEIRSNVDSVIEVLKESQPHESDKDKKPVHEKNTQSLHDEKASSLPIDSPGASHVFISSPPNVEKKTNDFIASKTQDVEETAKEEGPDIQRSESEKDHILPLQPMKKKISQETFPKPPTGSASESTRQDSCISLQSSRFKSNEAIAANVLNSMMGSQESIVTVRKKPASLSDALKSIDAIVSTGRKRKPHKKNFWGSKETIAVVPPPNSICNDPFEEIRKRRLKRSIQHPETESCETVLKRKLGPGAYNTIIGGFSMKNVEEKASGPGWSRQLEVERLAALPHLLHKEQWEENKMLKRKLGPGSYEIKDFIRLGNEKPRSGRGICDNLAPRFEKAVQSCTPGPGTYGSGGVPQRALEEKDIKATSTKGMLDAGDRKRNLPSVGSHLGPGTYQHKTCTDELLNKVTSLKGPYKLYSGDRNKPISEGYLAAPKLADLGPGQYEIGSFVDELNSTPRRIHGRFGKMAQYPEVPTDRIFLFSHAHYPKMNGAPGPGAYTPQELSKPKASHSPGFLSSAKRDDKMSQKFFTGNFNPVGAGRYDIQKFEEAQDVNGHSSVFKSKTGKPNLQMGKFLQERIRPKDVAVQDRVFLSQPQRMTRSITVM